MADGFSLEPSAFFQLQTSIKVDTSWQAVYDNGEVQGKLLFCGFDLCKSDAATKQLRHSIYKYVNSDKFNPVQTVEGEKILELFCEKGEKC